MQNIEIFMYYKNEYLILAQKISLYHSLKFRLKGYILVFFLMFLDIRSISNGNIFELFFLIFFDLDKLGVEGFLSIHLI